MHSQGARAFDAPVLTGPARPNTLVVRLRRPATELASGAGGSSFVLAFRHIHRTMLIAAGAFALAAAAGTAARAQGKLEARYEATLAGIPIGKGNWVVEIGDTHYNAAASGVTTGLIRVFTGGEGSSAAQGVISDGNLMSAIYTATIRTSHRTDKIRLVVADGNVKEFKVDPPVDADPERVPITEANQRGIVDPMSGSLL